MTDRQALTLVLNGVEHTLQVDARVTLLNSLSLSEIVIQPHGACLGALAPMSDVAVHPMIRHMYPVLPQGGELPRDTA